MLSTFPNPRLDLVMPVAPMVKLVESDDKFTFVPALMHYIFEPVSTCSPPIKTVKLFCLLLNKDCVV